MNFQNKVNELRKKDILNFKTNYFMNKINNNALYLENDNAIICLTQDRDIYRLYFAFINLFDFENILKNFTWNFVFSDKIDTFVPTTAYMTIFHHIHHHHHHFPKG